MRLSDATILDDQDQRDDNHLMPMSPYILGLDLGTNSLGWAAIGIDDNESPTHILGAGVRIFTQGTEGDIAGGKDESRNKKRRTARLSRRQTMRRQRRKHKIFRILQEAGLLPSEGEIGEIIAALDKGFLDVYSSQGIARSEISTTLPYYLRAQALERKLERYELGRVFYNLAQRRGFLSNRKAPVKDDEDLGQVKQGIVDLEDLMDRKGARTLGELFSRTDEDIERIRSRWTGRSMFMDEFDQIWNEQSRHYPELLNEDLKSNLRQTLFYQRPLKSQKDKIGECELEAGCRRAPKYFLQGQRWRILQNVNNMVIIDKSNGSQRSLADDERERIIHELDEYGTQTFAHLRKLIGLKRDSKFNLENGERKKLEGNSVNKKLRSIFQERLDDLSSEERAKIVEDVVSIQDDTALKHRGMQMYRLDEAQADEFSKCAFEDGYFNVSKKAILKMLPLLEEGLTYAEARKKIYPDADKPRNAYSYLPPTNSAIQSLKVLTNPVVSRSVTQLRKVVNAIIHEYGRPAYIRIELARDLKKSRLDRKKITKANRDNEKSRQDAAKKILEETGVSGPSRDDIEKVRLALEQGLVCPYTGKTISIANLIGSASQFDVDHIIPYSRSFDNWCFGFKGGLVLYTIHIGVAWTCP
ncbi:MAG: type II CRISPR RNA-guided endonuclease Cas9 [Acidimicrobiales bacterium]